MLDLFFLPLDHCEFTVDPRFVEMSSIDPKNAVAGSCVEPINSREVTPGIQTTVEGENLSNINGWYVFFPGFSSFVRLGIALRDPTPPPINGSKKLRQGNASGRTKSRSSKVATNVSGVGLFSEHYVFVVPAVG